jgi:hypothetical protein
VLADILRQAAGEPGTFVVSGACAPQAQEKLFKKVLHSPPRHLRQDPLGDARVRPTPSR